MKLSVFILFFFYSFYLNAQVFSIVDPNYSKLDFVNIIQENKNMNVTTYEYMYNGAGIAVGDINNDGLQDVFFTSNLNRNELYLNKGNLTFEKITDRANLGDYAGWSTGATMIDINNDGWLDIYVCKSAFKDSAKRRHQLFINNKDNTFSEKAKEFGLDDASYSSQAYFADFDGDGDLDLFLLNHPYNIRDAKKVVLSYNKMGALQAVESEERTHVSNRYYSNENGFFKDKTAQAGLLNHAFGLSAVVADFNQDGFLDIYTCNDYLQPDRLYINNGKAHFEPKEDSFFAHFSYFSMGSDYEDINNDGFNDLMVLDMLPKDNYRQKQFKQMLSYDEFYKNEKYGLKAQFVKNVLQLNYKNKRFSDIAYAANVSHTDWSWAPLIADFDNDGWKDIYISNGYYRDVSDMDVIRYKLDSFNRIFANTPNDVNLVDLQLSIFPTVQIPNYLYKNMGGLHFQDISKSSGISIPSWSNGAVYADLDNDGDLDIITNNINQYALLLENKTAKGAHHFLRLKLKSNTANNAFGTRIEIYSQDSLRLTSHFYPIKGYLSTHEPIVHIGLGNLQKIDAKIIWPNQSVQWLRNVQIDTLLLISEASMKEKNTERQSISSPKFEDITTQCQIDYLQKENPYIDFKLEPLLYRQFSKLGPTIAVGDYNHDGREDFFIGGAKDIAAQLYRQNEKGTFEIVKMTVWEQDKMFEDVKASWVDIDRDGDMDLIVLSGGNDYPKNKSMYPIRLYLQDDKGQFYKSNNPQLASVFVSAKSMAIADMDNDGYMDVFVGGYTVPGQFGEIPESYLFRNKKGVLYLDTSAQMLKKAGMISDAQWIDINRDGWLDLVVVGEWKKPAYYQNIKGILDSAETILFNQSGWWTAMASQDLNNDGVQDIVLGNYGVNSRYQCDTTKPLSMYVKDFDNNGSTDIYMTQYIGDSCYPVAQRDLLLDQMVFLKKRFYRYHQYANKKADEVFTQTEMRGARKYQITSLKSHVLLSQSNGTFLAIPLPDEAQFFPVQSILFDDIEKDGYKDMILLGNDYSAEIETGRLDAGHGLLIHNDKGRYFQTDKKYDLLISGDTKCAYPIGIQNKNAFIVGKNQGNIQVIHIK